MDYPIAFQPDLELDPADFVEAWNNDPEARAVATAQLEQPSQAQFDPFSAGLITVLTGVAGALATEALKHLVKKAIDAALEKRQKKKATSIQAAPQPGGTTLIVVTVINQNHDQNQRS